MYLYIWLLDVVRASWSSLGLTARLVMELTLSSMRNVCAEKINAGRVVKRQACMQRSGLGDDTRCEGVPTTTGIITCLYLACWALRRQSSKLLEGTVATSQQYTPRSHSLRQEKGVSTK